MCYHQRMAKSAQDMMESIQADIEDMEKLSRTEVRRDIADELLNMVKRGRDEDFAPYLTADPDHPKVYRIGIKPADFKVTPEFLAGVRFAAAALKDEDFDF